MKTMNIYLTLTALAVSCLSQTMVAQTEIKNDSSKRVKVTYKVACTNISTMRNSNNTAVPVTTETETSRIIEPNTTEYIMVGDQCFVQPASAGTLFSFEPLLDVSSIKTTRTPRGSYIIEDSRQIE